MPSVSGGSAHLEAGRRFCCFGKTAETRKDIWLKPQTPIYLNQLGSVCNWTCVHQQVKKTESVTWSWDTSSCRLHCRLPGGGADLWPSLTTSSSENEPLKSFDPMRQEDGKWLSVITLHPRWTCLWVLGSRVCGDGASAFMVLLIKAVGLIVITGKISLRYSSISF